jgi:uncharacterized protein YutE (UPF0331/DUF86 family)
MPIKHDDICLNKASIIEHTLRRAWQEYAMDRELQNCTHIDAMKFNVEQICQAAIDLAMHLVAHNHLGCTEDQCRRL